MIKNSLGNEVKESLYWEKEDKRKCKMYMREEETWEYI